MNTMKIICHRIALELKERGVEAYPAEYLDLIIMRSVIFYLENQLDSDVIAEDLLIENGEHVNLDYALSYARLKLENM